MWGQPGAELRLQAGTLQPRRRWCSEHLHPFENLQKLSGEI